TPQLQGWLSTSQASLCLECTPLDSSNKKAAELIPLLLVKDQMKVPIKKARRPRYVLKLSKTCSLRSSVGKTWTLLLVTILRVTFMKTTHIPEENVLEVHPGKQHFTFAELEVLINKDFVKQKYLEY
ncbi:hypothetical protein HPG69_018390, partial [Diceros bicornis minor]